MNNYKDKITMKFNIAQLDRIIIALINNPFNKKFSSNVRRLFSLFNQSSIKNEFDKEFRYYIINQITDIIAKNTIVDKTTLLDFLNFDGKYYNECTELLNDLFSSEIEESELLMLDRMISNQLRYSVILENSSELSDLLIDVQNENYDDLDKTLVKLVENLDTISNDIKSARESIEDAKKDLNLASSGFVNFLDGVIKKERNPATKIKTGIQYLNSMLNGRI